MSWQVTEHTGQVSSCRMPWCALRQLRCPCAWASEGTPGVGASEHATHTLVAGSQEQAFAKPGGCAGLPT